MSGYYNGAPGPVSDWDLSGIGSVDGASREIRGDQDPGAGCEIQLDRRALAPLSCQRRQQKKGQGGGTAQIKPDTHRTLPDNGSFRINQ